MCSVDATDVLELQIPNNLVTRLEAAKCCTNAQFWASYDVDVGIGYLGLVLLVKR